MKPIKAIVIGGSAGAIEALEQIFTHLSTGITPPVIVVLHLHPNSSAESLAEYFQNRSKLIFTEAEEKQPIEPGRIYLAPANYHLLVETDGSFSLTIDPKIKFSRPSIDVLFASAAEFYQENLLAILLSGASNDGVDGLKKVREFSGFSIIQTPETAQYQVMPQSAIQQQLADLILTPQEIGDWLTSTMHKGL